MWTCEARLALALCALIAACSDGGRMHPQGHTPIAAAGSGGMAAAGSGTMQEVPEPPQGAGPEPSQNADPEPPRGSADVRCGSDLPRVQAYDEPRAARGEALLKGGALTPGILPELVMRNLWVAWGVAPPASDEEFWQQASVRYGLTRVPAENDGLPMGMRRAEGGVVAFNCLLCHAGNVSGMALIGAANNRVDLESLFDDLVKVRDLAPSLGLPLLPVPFDLDGFTYAAGAQDAFGLGFRLVGAGRSFGPQRAPAWWQLAFKRRAFADGSGDASSHRSMMATLVAFGIIPDQLMARDEDFADVLHYLLSLKPPCWNLTPLDAQRVARGRATFDARCASCHGVHSGENASYPNRIVALDTVGTDPVRAQRFTSVEAAALNASWFGDPPFEATGGYLAPPLVGIWARAPYFHNGSVPDLIGVLDPTARPRLWKRLELAGSDYDPERVGLRYEVVSASSDPNTRDGRLVYDTSREGMGNQGHDFAASLSDAERADLLEYLRTL